MTKEKYEIVCPDGVVRHHPFHIKREADADARMYTERACCIGQQGVARSLCPQGAHEVRPVAPEVKA